MGGGEGADRVLDGTGGSGEVTRGAHTSPANIRGIELNAYAAELARMSVSIGEIQWMRRNGFQVSRDPILKPLETIECRDAILTTEGVEPEWPAADIVIGNPPFLGGKLLRPSLGGEYVEALRVVCGHPCR